MPDQADVARLAAALPFACPSEGHFGFEVRHGSRHRGFVWVWQERVAPGQPRVANPGVVAVRVADLSAKDELLAADPDVFFTDAHYDGYAAVLVRLDAVDERELAELLEDAWRASAPAELVRRFDAGHRDGPGPPQVS